jgi:hypothetical protein
MLDMQREREMVGRRGRLCKTIGREGSVMTSCGISTPHTQATRTRPVEWGRGWLRLACEGMGLQLSRCRCDAVVTRERVVRRDGRGNKQQGQSCGPKSSDRRQ